ncbi:hypothetical protein GY12_25265 [Micrococcus luteus]|nr:hypothetical protein GY12_25265 [Micrococcus luteus]
MACRISSGVISCAVSSVIRSLSTCSASSMSTVCRLSEANAVTRISAPSSSRMFVEMREAMYSSASGGATSPSASAFFRRIAMRVSRSGGWMSVISPHSKRERSRSSNPESCLGGRSEVMTTCLLLL